MLLDTRALLAPVDAAWLGESVPLLGYAGDDEVATALEVELDIAAALPLRPVHLKAHLAPGGDIAISWVRRSRADTDGWAAEDAPLDFAPEAYRVEIVDGETVVRSITCNTASVSYTLAQQTVDFGGAAAGFTFRVAQVSAVHGPGHWATGDFHD